MLLSFINILAPTQINAKISVVITALKATSFPSNASVISDCAISEKIIAGRQILKVNLFAAEMKPSLNIPILLNIYPRTITRKTGIVALRL